MKKKTTFWLIFGLSPNLGLSDSLSERLIQKMKRPTVRHVIDPRRSVSAKTNCQQIQLLLQVVYVIINTDAIQFLVK